LERAFNINTMRKIITAVVPVRKGSQRVKSKNIRNFNGTNLLSIKLKVLKDVKIIDRIVVSTDCDECVKIAQQFGVDVHIRDPHYASSHVSNSEFFENLARSIDGDYLLYTPVTAPMIKVDTYYDFINRFMLASNQHDSMVTATYVKHHMWLDNKPLNYDPLNSPNTQDLPDVLKLTYGLNIIDRNTMIECKNVVGKSSLFYILDDVEGIDIDTPMDFEIAEFLYKKYYM